MAGRPSKLYQASSGEYRTTIKGVLHYLGTDERKAQRAFHQLMAGTLRDTPTDDAPETITGAATAWLALNDRECYRRWLKPFEAFAGEKFLDDVKPDLLTKFALHLKGVETWRGTPLSLRSIRHSVNTAAAVLRWASKQKWLAEVPDVPKLPKPALVDRDIPTARLTEILGSIRKGPRRILSFIAATGCRPSEACELQWAHVRFDMNACILPLHKTAASGAARTIYLTTEAETVLRELQKMEPAATGHIFRSHTGNPYTPDLLRKIMHRRGANAYALRHSFAQRAVDAGTPLEEVAGLLGHASVETTRTYARVRSQRLVNAAKRLRIAAG